MKAISARLEVARMLKAGDIYEDIVQKTGASTATISRIKRCLVYGETAGTKRSSAAWPRKNQIFKLSK